MLTETVLRFEWDPMKARANEQKHGVTFEAALLVFEDPLRALSRTTAAAENSGGRRLGWWVVSCSSFTQFGRTAETKSPADFSHVESGDEDAGLAIEREAVEQRRELHALP